MQQQAAAAASTAMTYRSERDAKCIFFLSTAIITDIHTISNNTWISDVVCFTAITNTVKGNDSYSNRRFLGAMQICIARTSYGNVSVWVAGWLAGCLSQPVLYQNY